MHGETIKFRTSLFIIAANYKEHLRNKIIRWLCQHLSAVYYYIEIIITCFIQIRYLKNSTYALKHLISNCNNQNARILSWH